MKLTGVLVFLACLLAAPVASAMETIPGIDVLIDAGHGGVDGGTSHQQLLEKNLNLQLGKRLYKQLSAKGYHVVLNRTGDYALSEENSWLKNPSRHLRDLAQRKHLALELNPQILISLHVNWSTDSNQRGAVVLYQKTNQSYFLAELLQNSLNDLYRQKEKPVKGSTYYVLNHSPFPAVIIETGFISNAQDRYWLTNSERQEEICQAIVGAIEQYFWLVGKFSHS
ncbi:N-acetylmuramoyl-L-alanine amidase family protein [Brevibacillus fulvus]|uniref:N-acetylmuramoyl-L-alanine amidase n=1 Tax=Brevibacillus fulvus TaxID=1125967 RepID=A0A938Y2Y7_9BACL|nr:N-acetylmuramoyl-L-alanine amidase [Brevibacillus fulvus]MBM7591006.1 N-acetylmuramoyl-L-alanine amidase [Brevibacillus fulvus]